MPLVFPELPDCDAPEVARAGARAVLELRGRWNLTWAQLARLLGVGSERPLQNWTARVPERLAPDVLDRMGYLIGISHALERIRGGERSEQWLRAPNAGHPFLGRAPLDVMLDGRTADLVETYRYLRGVATGTF